MIIHPYKKGSKSVAALKAAMGEDLRILYRPSRHRNAMVVHWGVSDLDYPVPPRVRLNPPGVTRAFCNKLEFFSKAEIVPEWTTGKAAAQTILDAGGIVVERHVLNGSGGDGIRIVEPGGELQAAPLYVRYEKKTDEFRIHVFKNKQGEFYVGHTQKKVAKKGVEVGDWKVRNLANGFCFQLHGYDCPAVVSTAAIYTARIFGADFVALDIIYHKPTDKAYVLEGNTAPGLEGTTVEKYVTFFKERLV